MIEFFKIKPKKLKNIKLIKVKKSKDLKASYIVVENVLYIYRRYFGYWAIRDIDFSEHIIDIMNKIGLFLLDEDEYGEEFMRTFQNVLESLEVNDD
jgi:hypothetical protein